MDDQDEDYQDDSDYEVELQEVERLADVSRETVTWLLAALKGGEAQKSEVVGRLSSELKNLTRLAARARKLRG